MESFKQQQRYQYKNNLYHKMSPSKWKCKNTNEIRDVEHFDNDSSYNIKKHGEFVLRKSP